jgi:signal transduction histidine kinase
MKVVQKIIFILIAVFFLQQKNIAQSVPIFIVDDTFSQKNIGTLCYHRSGEDFKIFRQVDSSWKPVNATKKWLWPFATQWLCVQLHNTGKHDRQLKFFLNNVQAGNSKMYVVANGIVDSSMQTGSLMPPQLRANTDRFLSMPFVLKVGITTQLYIKTYRRQIGITLTPNIEDPGIADTHKGLDYFMVFALSLLLLISIVSVALFISFPSKESAWFALYTAVTFFFILSASGFGALFLWGSYPLFEENGAVFLGALGATCIFELSRAVFAMNTQYPRLSIFLKLFSIVNVTISILGFGLMINRFSQSTYTIALSWIYLLQLVAYLWVFYVSFVEAFKKKKKEFWWFFVVFSFIIFLSFVLVFQEVGLVNFNYRFHSVMLAAGLIPQTILPLIFFIRRVVKMLEKRQAEITEAKLYGEQKLLNERLRVSQELHDEVGATLSGIAMYSHLAKEQIKSTQTGAIQNSLNVIQSNASEMVNKLNDIVWLINPGQDSLQKLMQRLEDYAVQIAAVKNIRVKSNLNGHFAENILPAEIRRNIYLLFKEAINNAVKYSNATLLDLNVKEDNTAIKISLKDDGDGFDVDIVKHGNGLDNMQQRAKDMQTVCMIESAKGKGTSITVVIKIP